MRLLFLCIFLLCTLNAENEGAEKRAFLMKRAKESSNGVIDHITKGEFRKHVAEGPREYGIMLFLTVLGSESSCKICGQVHSATEELARALNARDVDSAESVFVIEIDYTASHAIISELGLDRVPQVLYVPKTKSSRSVALQDLIASLGQKYQHSMMTGYEMDNFVEFINKAGKLNIDLAQPVGKVEVIVFFAIIISTLVLVYMTWNIIDQIRRNMLLYAVVGVAFYCFCIGGGMYSRIRNTPYMGGTSKSPEYIQRQSRSQYTVEGYLMGIANFIGGIGVFLYVLANKISTGRIQARIIKYLPSFIGAGLFFFSWYSILSVYNIKAPHYRMGFVGMTG